MSSFFKQLYRYSRPRSYRHNENLWPYVKITRSDSGEIIDFFYKKQHIAIVPLSRLKDRCQGSILLTATGPSVRDICFENAPILPAMGVNGAYFLRQVVDFRFYIIVDTNFIDQRTDIIENIILADNVILFITVDGITKIIDKLTLARVKCQIAIIEDAAKKTYHPKIEKNDLWTYYRHHHSISFLSSNKTIAFNHDIRHGVFDAGTVIYWALQIIAFLGFKQVFILGLDMNNFQSPRFYEVLENMQPTSLPEKIDNIIIPSFTHASNCMKSRGISVNNLSLNSAIEDKIFEKVSYHEAIKKVNSNYQSDDHSDNAFWGKTANK